MRLRPPERLSVDSFEHRRWPNCGAPRSLRRMFTGWLSNCELPWPIQQKSDLSSPPSFRIGTDEGTLLAMNILIYSILKKYYQTSTIVLYVHLVL